MAFESIEDLNDFVQYSNSFSFIIPLDTLMTYLKNFTISEEDFTKVSKQYYLYKNFIRTHPYYRFTNPETSLALHSAIKDMLTRNSIQDDTIINEALSTAFTQSYELASVNNLLGFRSQECKFETFCIAYNEPHATLSPRVQPLMSFSEALDFETVRRAALNPETYSYLDDYQNLKDAYNKHEITSDMFGLKLLSSNNEFIKNQLIKARNKYLFEVAKKVADAYNVPVNHDGSFDTDNAVYKDYLYRITNIGIPKPTLKDDEFFENVYSINVMLGNCLNKKMRIPGSQTIIDTILNFQMRIAKVVNCIASSIQRDIIDENVVGTELLKGDIMVFGEKRNYSPTNTSFRSSAAIVSDKLDLGNGKSLIEFTDPKGSYLATPLHFGIGNGTTSVAIARANTTTVKREEAAKHAKELSKTIKKDRIFKDHESPMEG
jgi:hypothetical protein